MKPKHSEPITQPYPRRSHSTNGGSELTPLDKAERSRRKLLSAPDEEAWEESSEVTANLHQGVRAKGVPRLGMLIISVAIAVFIVALGAWLVK